MDEATYRKHLADNGVELPEEPKEETPEEPKPEEPKEPAKEPEEPKAPLETPKPEERKPRSIYDEYKDQKSERKLAEERADKAERERDELARKLEEAKGADGGDADDTAKDAIEYAKKVGADPDLVKRIIDDAQKGFEAKADPDVVKRLERFEAWEKSNAKTVEAQRFNDEFASVLPSLKESFSTASAEELDAIKKELDTISHTKEWHDKDLDYVAYKNRDKLSALVSPKKRGMESKGRADVETPSYEFDPNADYAKMTAAERTAWEKQYKEMMKSEGLQTDAQGRRFIV